MELTPSPNGEPLVLPAYLPAFVQLRVPVNSPVHSQGGAKVAQLWSNMPEPPPPAAPAAAAAAAGGLLPWESPVTLQPCDLPMHGCVGGLRGRVAGNCLRL